MTEKPYIPISPRMSVSGTRAEIQIFGEIGESAYSARNFEADLEELRNRGCDHVTLRINSPGGQCTEALSMYDTMTASPMSYTAYITGECASAATLLACAADTVTMAPSAVFMIHEPTAGIYGTAKELQADIKLLENIRERVLAIYAEKTGRSKSDVEAMLSPASWLTAQEAVAAGFVDNIDGVDAEATANATTAPEMKCDEPKEDENEPKNEPEEPQEDEDKADEDEDTKEDENEPQDTAEREAVGLMNRLLTLFGVKRKVSAMASTPATRPAVEQLHVPEVTAKEYAAVLARAEAAERELADVKAKQQQAIAAAVAAVVAENTLPAAELPTPTPQAVKASNLGASIFPSLRK